MKGHIEEKRMKDISMQLVKVIHILCNSKGEDIQQTFCTYTNITQEEWNILQKKRNKEEKRGNTSF